MLMLDWTVDHQQIADHLLTQGVHGVTSNNLELVTVCRPDRRTRRGAGRGGPPMRSFLVQLHHQSQAMAPRVLSGQMRSKRASSPIRAKCSSSRACCLHTAWYLRL